MYEPIKNWNCKDELDKEIVLAIIEGNPLPPNSRRPLRRLIEYGFILEEGQHYRMAIPIFEQWVKMFG